MTMTAERCQLAPPEPRQACSRFEAPLPTRIAFAPMQKGHLLGLFYFVFTWLSLLSFYASTASQNQVLFRKLCL